MSYQSSDDLRQIRFTKRLPEASEFERAAFRDINPFIEMQDADLDNIRVTACWLHQEHSAKPGDACLLFLIPYYGRRVGVYGFRMYLAMPERLLVTGSRSYAYAGAVTLDRNEEVFIGTSRADGNRFYDITTFEHRRLTQIYAYDNWTGRYQRVHPVLPERALAGTDQRLAAGRLTTASPACFKVRWRSRDRATALERNLIEWITASVFPGRHDPRRVDEVVVSRQMLFQGDRTAQTLLLFPAGDATHPTFYIVSADNIENPAVIGDNPIAKSVLYIHSNWIVEGAKVLSSVIDDEWVGYVCDGTRYSFTTPSLHDAHRVDATAAPREWVHRLAP